jgi:hypothetical protein
MVDIYKIKKMKKFGILKSKIEKLMLESYGNGTFKEQVKNFKLLVLENKNISKLFYLYDELNSKKGLSESVVDDYINECITIYENTVNKVKDSTVVNLNKWVYNVKSENNYSHIDDLFSSNVLNIESRIASKKIIKESLKKKPIVNKETVNLPLSTMVNVANKTISNYIENLNESEKKELFDFLKKDDKELMVNFETLKEEVKEKLSQLKSSSDDSETMDRINETIEKVDLEKYDKFSYFKLKNLKENL